tara:strand:- start:120 stop:590 length:471 start_codon:yes stop_codon:yes gene_type:complete
MGMLKMPSGRVKGSKGRRTIAINEAVENCFRMENKNGAYLKRLAAMENPALFVTLLAKCIPQAIAIDVTAHALDLGLAMREAQDRLNALHGKTVTVEDITEQPPELLIEQSNCVQLPDLPIESISEPGGKTVKPLSVRRIRVRKRPGGGSGIPPAS